MPVVVVLAGGSNSRFWPLRAKTLLSLAGRTLLERHLDGFIAAGVRRFVVVANEETAGETKALVAGLPADVLVTVQAEPKGMGDAVLTAAAALPDLERGPIIISQAHDVVEPELYQHFIADAEQNGTDGLLAAKRMTEYFPGGYLTVDGARVTGLVEKPEPQQRPSDLVSFVLHYHHRPGALLEAIRSAYGTALDSDDHYERAIAALLPQLHYRAHAYEGPWQAVKYPWHALNVMDQVLQDLTPMANPPAEASGAVYIEEGVRIFPGARIVGPAWIGAGSIIGNNSLVRGSILGRHVEVGYGSEVARSLLGDRVTLHHNYIGDTVIGDNVGVGFGTVTGNWPFYPSPVRSTVKGQRLRTDMDKFGAVIGSDSRTGIGVLLYPGVKVGARTFVGPGVVVTKDIPDGRLIVVKQELDDRPNPFR